MGVRQKLEVWVQKNPDGYLCKTYKQIGTEAGISSGSVDRYLCEIIAERDGCMPSDVIAKRAEAGFKRQNRLTLEEIEDIRQRSNEGMHPRDIAYITGHHIVTVEKYLKEGEL